MAEGTTARVPYVSPVDAEHWPATNIDYLKWAYEQARAMQTDLDSTVESIRKRAALAAFSHWIVVGWLLASSLGEHILAQHWMPKLIALLLMIGSGVLMLLVVAPRTVKTPTIQALIGEEALRYPIAGSLLAAIEQVDRTYANQRDLSNKRGTLTACCQGVSCVGVLTVLILALL
jgi:hypothetical protein